MNELKNAAEKAGDEAKRFLQFWVFLGVLGAFGAVALSIGSFAVGIVTIDRSLHAVINITKKI